MHNLNVFLITSSVFVYVTCVGEVENVLERKRYDLSLETCIENFDVHEDKIIRTADSRAMGAKYLNEAEVNARDECMKLCCQTPNCDVFVFEQKVPGSCYLFHCGSPEDFKCKFTQHKNYTSAVLALNNRLNQLQNRIKLNKHEQELNMLRKLDLSVETTTGPPQSTKVPTVSTSSKQVNSTKSQCSRYQFECKESGECIAIYNACDGIPQCSDGSDEAPELYCPTISGTSHPNTFHEQLKSLKGRDENTQHHEKTPEVVSLEPPQPKQLQVKPPSPPKQQAGSMMGFFPYGYAPQNDQVQNVNHPKQEAQSQAANLPRYYGREGEIVQYPVSQQWQGYQPQHQVSDDNSHIFNHKGGGLNTETSDRYTNREYLNKYHHGQFQSPYNNEMSHAEYLKYAAAAASNGYYGNSNPVYYNGPNVWPQRVPQQPHSLEDGPQRPLLSLYGNGMSGFIPSDYYYEDSQMRKFPQRLPAPEVSNANRQQFSAKDSEKPETLQEPNKSEEPKKTESVKKTLENLTQTSIKTSTKAEATTATAEVVKKEKQTKIVAEHLKMVEELTKDIDGVNERPSGAILSLTLGMCITAIMITLVGCRLRVVRKRMRRNSKSPYAHDADFLVNGMYL